MQVVIASILFYILIGGIGMYFGNRKVDVATARQRWLKYIVFILLTTALVLSMWFHFFLVFAITIIFFGYYELLRTIPLTRKSWTAIFIYTIVVLGFLVYAIGFRREVQFFIYFQVLAFDAFSQVVGQLVGKHSIASRISPSKTVEGFLGGMFFCVLSAVLISGWFGVSVWTAIVVGCFTSVAAFAGDLSASYYKRIAGIKDYSNLLPGQGGFLDRFDSLMGAAFFYSIVYFLALKTGFTF